MKLRTHLGSFSSWLCSFSRVEWLVFAWLTALVIMTSWTLAQPTFFRVHDYVHAARIAELVRSAQAGHLPVRWTENFGFGYGMPLFEFYAPLPYYVGGLIYWMTNDVILATKFLFFLPNLLSVVGAYLLGTKLFGKKGGIVVATAYALAPYRAVNLFVRGAVSESWGSMVLPWIIWTGILFVDTLKRASIVRSQKNITTNFFALVLSLVVLLLSHNLTTLMFVPISGLVLILYAWQQKLPFLRSSLQLAAAYMLAIGLCAFYLFPALLEKDFTIISSILSGYFYYSHHFLYIRQFFTPNWGYGGSAWGPDDGLSFFLGYGQLAAVLLGMVGVAWYIIRFGWRRGGTSAQRLTWAWRKATTTTHFHWFMLSGCLMVGALFLTLLKSEWLWQHVPLLSYIQFPWRWLAVANIFLAIMTGYVSILVTSQRVLRGVVLGLLAAMTLNAVYFQPESYIQKNTDFYYTDPELIRTEMSGVLPDYIPVGLKLAKLATPEQATQTAFLPVNAAGTVLTPESEQRATKFSIELNRPHQKLLSIELAEPTTVVFAVATYPGWYAEINGVVTKTSSTNEGLVAVEMPAGKHQLGLLFGSTPVRFWSDVISGLSLLVVLFIIAPNYTKNTRL